MRSTIDIDGSAQYCYYSSACVHKSVVVIVQGSGLALRSCLPVDSGRYHDGTKPYLTHDTTTLRTQSHQKARCMLCKAVGAV